MAESNILCNNIEQSKLFLIAAATSPYCHQFTSSTIIAVSTMISISDNVIHGFKAIVLLSCFLGNLVSSSNLLPDNSGMPSICRIISIEEEGGEVVEKKDSQREREKDR